MPDNNSAHASKRKKVSTFLSSTHNETLDHKDALDQVISI